MRKLRDLDWVAIAIIAGAALLRFVLLGIKPPHFDEGVNGWFVDQITRRGSFHYDPENYHGPLHFYVLFLFQTLLGRNIHALRVPIAAISALTVWLVLAFDRFIDRRICRWAAAALAVSPAAVFYGRYAIHESWLVIFLLLWFWGLAGLWRFGEKKYLWAAAAGLTGTILIKETYTLHFVCFLLALAVLFLLEKVAPSSRAEIARPQWSYLDLGLAILAGAATVVFFYSGTFLDFSSLKGLYRMFHAWWQTGVAGHGHEKPFYYWAKLILYYEAPALLGLIAALAYLLPGRDRFLRLMAIYGGGTIAAYSIIHYKTPWCIISLTWPLYFLFGDSVINPRFGPRLLRHGLAVAALITSLVLCVRLNFFHYTDESEPYVYVQTFEDVNKLMAPLKTLTAENPENYQMTGHILLSSYHPLPWLLGDFTHIGYYGMKQTPSPADGDFLIVEDKRRDEIEGSLRGRYFAEDFKLRASQDPSKLYLRYETFRKLFPGRTPEFEPSATAP